MPLLRSGRRIAHPLDRGALAFFELPQHEVVFEAIGADGQVIAVRLQIEQDPGALIDTARQSLKAHRDFAACEIFDAGHDGVGKVGVSLYTVEKLRIAFTIERARLIGDARRRLPFLPLPPVDGEHLLSILVFDPPVANDRHKRLWLGSDGFAGKINGVWLSRKAG